MAGAFAALCSLPFGIGCRSPTPRAATLKSQTRSIDTEMKADSPNWIVMGAPATPQEAAALEAFRKVLPDDGRTTAWVNLTFIDSNNRTAEVDVLLLTPVGFFCVELKGWHGTITGNSQRWYQPGKTHENPFLVTDRKGKRLASLLKSYAPNQQVERAVPWVTPLIVLHGEGSTFAVDQSGRPGVIKLNGYSVASQPALRRLSEFLTTPPANPRDSIDPQRADIVRRLCQKANFLPTPKTRMVSDYAVAESEPIAEGIDWQDVLVTHPNLPKFKQRLRLYDVPPKAAASERKRIGQLAQREYQLTYGIRHGGIAVPQQYLETTEGPALVFEYQDAERPLDVFMVDEGATLGLEVRVALVEQLGDILRFAHNRHLFHRALSPQRVWVRSTPSGPRLEVRDWYAAQKDRGSTETSGWTVISKGITDLVGVAAAEDLIWLAPEARHSVSNVPGAPLDIFGFGALAFLILTGKPPATTIAEVEAVQQQMGGFDPRSVTAGLPDGLAEVVTVLTSVGEAERPESVADSLELMRFAWDEVRRPDDSAPRVEVEDPIDAQTGDMIEGRFLVTGRRGEGSSGVALAVLDDHTRDDKEVILKIARDDAAGRRLKAEGEVLTGLDHPSVVRLVESLDLGGRHVLVMTDAGKETLATRLVKEGQATLDHLQRWGTDLLEAMAYVGDVKGIFHRDIKPANLGISPDPRRDKKPHLTLFDFSLAREPLENTGSGTRGYLDPYLGKGRRTRYDRAAELWAVSVTLFEMATGVLPWWANGAGAPSSPTERPVVEPTSFDPAVAVPLAELFSRALSPDLNQRFGNVEDLLQAWTEVFASLTLDEVDRYKDDELADRATLDTPLEQSGLSAQALSALRRLDGVVTVGQVLGVPPVKVNFIPGLGATYRKEIQTRIRQWRTALRPIEPAPEQEVALGVDRVVEHLLEMLPASNQIAVRALLGLGGGTLWLTAAEIATQFQMTREQVTKMINDAVNQWSNDGAFLSARSELARLLKDSARVMTVDEAVVALVTLRGSTLDGEERKAFGTALLRAVLELDARDSEPLFVLRRRSGKSYLLSLSEDTGVEDYLAFPAADLLNELAGELGAAADEIVEGGITTATVALSKLRTVITDLDSSNQWKVSDGRLLRLAAAASKGAAVSGFQELYPRNMPVRTALEHAMRGKPGRSISALAVRRTVGARFPQLDEALPTSPDKLDALMVELYPDLVNRTGIYEPKSTVLSRTGTVSTTQFTPAPAAEITRKLKGSLERHAALTLTVTPKRYESATRALAAAFDVDVLDIAAMVVAATEEEIKKADGIWQGLLSYDAMERDTKQWDALERIVQKSFEPVWAKALTSARPLLLTNAGPLIRYGMAPLLASLIDTGSKRAAARWLLVSKPGDAPTPLIEGRSVPLGPSGWIELPRDLTQFADRNSPDALSTITNGEQA